MKLCFATNNLHKIQEVTAVLGQSVQLLSLNDIGCTEELPEEEDTLEDNSLSKARFVYTHYHTDCFADDSGLEVAALDGAPGVHSAYYAGPQRNAADNIALLLESLEGITDRSACFRTVITLLIGGAVHTFEGRINGAILTEPKGTGGFGYDPVFRPEGSLLTFAEMGADEKNAVSHRALAVTELARFLEGLK